MPKKKTYSPSDILSMVKEKQESQAFRDLVEQMETDFDRFTLVPYQPRDEHGVIRKGAQSYTSPKPRNDFLKVLNGLNKAMLVWQIVTEEDAPEDERKAVARGEDFLTGILAEADKRLRLIGEPPLKQSLDWIAVARGMVGLKCLIYTNEDKETEIDIRPLDPMHMAWEQGVNGLVWAAFYYNISKTECEERYGVDLDKEDTALVVDFFDTSINAVVLSTGGGKKQWIKKPTPHNLERPPIFVGFAGSMPTIYTKDNEPTIQHRANSVYSSSRNVYDPYNKQVSFLMDKAEQSVAGTLVHASKGGKKLLKGNPFSSWQVINVATDEDESIGELKPPSAPAEVGAILAILDRDKQESTVPYPIGFGLDEQGHSGAALAIMTDNTRSIYDPFCGLIQEAYRWLCEEILSQFKTKGKKVDLRGYNQKGKFFKLQASPSDIEEDWYINVVVEPQMPRDEEKDLQMALQATQARPPYGTPLLSDQTVREKMLKLTDPDAEKELIKREAVEAMIEKMPQVQIRKMAKAMLDAGDREGAEEFLASMPPPGGPSPQSGGQGGPPMGQPGMPQGQGMPQLSPQELQQAMAMAEQLLRQGKPIPPELEQVLRQAGGQPQI